ncbi:MAG: type II toxin-antitoxin system Phd/YefM family antitoxin [Anaerolineae bacterium]
MPKTVSAKEAKNRLGTVIEWVVENRDEVVIESRGKPTAVVMAYAEYEEVLTLRARQEEQARRRVALARLEQLRKQVQAETPDITEEEALALGDQLARDAVDRLVRKGQIRFGDE